jgi:hypothetical protein
MRLRSPFLGGRVNDPTYFGLSSQPSPAAELRLVLCAPGAAGHAITTYLDQKSKQRLERSGPPQRVETCAGNSIPTNGNWLGWARELEMNKEALETALNQVDP